MQLFIYLLVLLTSIIAGQDLEMPTCCVSINSHNFKPVRREFLMNLSLVEPTAAYGIKKHISYGLPTSPIASVNI